MCHFHFVHLMSVGETLKAHPRHTLQGKQQCIPKLRLTHSFMWKHLLCFVVVKMKKEELLVLINGVNKQEK